LDLIEREVPVTEKMPEKSKSGLYRITDNFIAFWFKFVYPYRAYLEKGETEYVMSRIKEGFVQNYLSFVYEDVCRDKIWQMSVNGELGFNVNRVGRYWGAKIGEVDIVAIDDKNDNILVGECKYSTTQKGLSVLHTLQEKAEVIKALTNAKSVSYVIFSKEGFTKGLIDEAERNNGKIKLLKE
jgi:AAA+ ATPase superfamily predicted ATPase